jgi:P-type Na+/K+ transporter
MIDMMVYGVWMAALCLASFLLVLFGFGGGHSDVGHDCNQTYSPDCEVVFRARATTFASLTWFALFLAWEMVHMRRSFFRMQPGSKRYFTQWFHDTWRNKFLFWAIVGGVVTMFPILYIPGLSTVVFKHTGITWEWGIVFIESVLFFLGIEGWKFAKRVYFRRQAKKAGAGLDLETRTFGHYFTQSGSSDSSSGVNTESEAEKARARGVESPRNNREEKKALQ